MVFDCNAKFIIKRYQPRVIKLWILTSIEFQKHFFNAMRQALSRKHSNKIVIVIDNLDRLDVEDSIKLWSTMRTFFNFDKSENKEFMKDVWLIVPYDPDGIRKLWETKNFQRMARITKAEKFNDENEKNETVGKHIDTFNENTDIVNSFLDKPFKLYLKFLPNIIKYGDIL